MAIPPSAQNLLQEAVDAGVGSAAALAWQVGDERALFATGRTAQTNWSNQLATTDSLFDLASLTKPICTLTLLVGELAAGHITLDDRLDAHLRTARNTQRGSATIGQLMSHTSGAPAWLDYFAATRDVPPEQRIAAVQRAVLTTPNAHPPGTNAVYSDLGYMSLGWLLEQRAGRPLDILFEERIARPLGLRIGFRRISQPQATLDGVVATEVWAPRCTDSQPLRGVVHDDNCAALDGVAGHAGLFGSVRDVATWADAWLSTLCDQPGKGASAIGLTLDVCNHLVWTAGCPQTTWRHGWDTPTRPGSSAGDHVPSDAFGHLGFTGTSVWFSPQSRALAVLLTNRVHPTRDAVEGIRALRPHLHDRLWQSLPFCAPAEGAHPPIDSSRP
jgi:CubicO group peptidase (beta-lactamase class C family)